VKTDWQRKVWRTMWGIGRYRCYWKIYFQRNTSICLHFKKYWGEILWQEKLNQN
jgi:hypothetical protein